MGVIQKNYKRKERKMKFSEVLKSVRNSHGDSLRKLSEKTGINFSYIDKVEKEIRPVNSEFLEKII